VFHGYYLFIGIENLREKRSPDVGKSGRPKEKNDSGRVKAAAMCDSLPTGGCREGFLHHVNHHHTKATQKLCHSEERSNRTEDGSNQATNNQSAPGVTLSVNPKG